MRPTARSPSCGTILETLRDERQQLISLRDELPAGLPSRRRLAARADDPAVARAREQAVQRKRLRLRMQGVIDRMQAGVARIDEIGVTLREIETGLIDFPALASGRQIWLCWRLGEGESSSGTSSSDGFGGRRPLSELPDGRGARPMDRRRPATILQNGRAKAYRPLPADERRAAFDGRRSRPTTAATSSRRTSCWSRPGWAPTISPSAPSTRA